ncbi:hypothetical protein I316_02184 [Kwoniella heveanensis BCC8398]|uniref:SET domain-containing protein n=1 Tax=Kwoniella heveanensis BCC8398 TaxID=1296120 RepID=A0A1B9GZ71_9TREE|nr:hypothetical protein I316_02184 [Kwoniella heveanensis BCC8398]
MEDGLDDQWLCNCSVDHQSLAQQKWLCTVADGESCDCGSGCAPQGNFYTPTILTLNLDALPERLPLVECSPACPCVKKCANRVTQHGVRVPLAIRPLSSELGLGLFYSPSTDISSAKGSFMSLAKGSFISLYAGEYLTTGQARTRWARQRSDNASRERQDSQGQGNYILSLRLPGQVIHIDPRYKGNVGRFLNHSCEPNCVIHPVKWGADDPWYRAAIFTRRDIRPDEELTFDYADASGSALQPAERRRTIAAQEDGTTEQSERVRCLCGSDKCRGWMPFDGSW